MGRLQCQPEAASSRGNPRHHWSRGSLRINLWPDDGAPGVTKQHGICSRTNNMGREKAGSDPPFILVYSMSNAIGWVICYLPYQRVCRQLAWTPFWDLSCYHTKVSGSDLWCWHYFQRWNTILCEKHRETRDISWYTLPSIKNNQQIHWACLKT